MVLPIHVDKVADEAQANSVNDISDGAANSQTEPRRMKRSLRLDHQNAKNRCMRDADARQDRRRKALGKAERHPRVGGRNDVQAVQGSNYAAVAIRRSPCSTSWVVC